MESMDELVHFTEYPYAEGDPQKVLVLQYALRHTNGARGSRPTARVHPAAVLQEHLEWIYGWGFTPITLADYRHFLRGELHLPKRPVILTFESALEDLDEGRFKPLFECGGRAVLFVVTGRKPTLPAGEHSPFTEPVTHMGDMLRRLHARGIEIGSLTCTNRKLPALTTEDVEEELLLSKRMLEHMVRGPVLSVAYPGNDVTPAVKRSVIKTGYEFAVAGPEAPPLFGTDLYEIRRMKVPDSIKRTAFALMLFSPSDRWERLRRRSLAFFQRGTRGVTPEASA